MRQIAKRQLWTGNAGDLWDISAVLSEGIEAIIELADSEVPAILPREIIHLRFPLSDGGDNPAWLIQLAIESIAKILDARIPLLVCCSAGMSRSVCISAAGISKFEQIPFRDALLEVIGTGAADVSPRLLTQVQQVLV